MTTPWAPPLWKLLSVGCSSVIALTVRVNIMCWKELQFEKVFILNFRTFQSLLPNTIKYKRSCSNSDLSCFTLISCLSSLQLDSNAWFTSSWESQESERSRQPTSSIPIFTDSLTVCFCEITKTSKINILTITLYNFKTFSSYIFTTFQRNISNQCRYAFLREISPSFEREVNVTKQIYEMRKWKKTNTLPRSSLLRELGKKLARPHFTASWCISSLF